MDFALRETQTRYYALDLKNLAEQFSVDDSFNLLRLNLKDADADGSLKFIVSTYDPYDRSFVTATIPADARFYLSSTFFSMTCSRLPIRSTRFCMSGRKRWGVP